MRVQLDEIREEGLLRHITEDAGNFPELRELVDAAECFFPEPLQIEVRLQRSGEMVETSGSLTGTIRQSCGRCLREFDSELNATFAVTFVRELPRIAEESGEGELELSAEELGLIACDGDVIDLGPLVQEQVLLALPLRPLCREECRGLCPQCGADLNEQSCTCSSEQFNSKFAKLREFKVQN